MICPNPVPSNWEGERNPEFYVWEKEGSGGKDLASLIRLSCQLQAPSCQKMMAPAIFIPHNCRAQETLGQAFFVHG